MTFHRVGQTAVLDELLGYGTSEGVKKSWEKRRRAQPRQMALDKGIFTKEGYLNVDNLSQVGGQMGSNKGGVFQAPDGTQYYVKQYADEDHARNEVLAAKLYEAAGARVPQIGLGTWLGNTVVASKMISGLQTFKNQPGAAEKFIAAGAQEDFAADAWLVNWDSVGLEYDNLGIANGKIVRMDTGGALVYRAQGGDKPPMKSEVGELDSLRGPVPWDKHTNPQAYSVYGSMTDDKLKTSIKKVISVPDSTIRHLVLKFGPRDVGKNLKLMNDLIARKNNLKERYKSMGGVLA